MKIYSMTATFGKLEHETLTLQPGLNIIHAPNEWGKSTWCSFLVAMLYGFEARARTTQTALSDKEHYTPWSGSPMAGRIDLNWDGRDITIERRTKGRSVFGDFKAYETASGLPVPELTAANCGSVLLGVEKSVFTRSAFIRLTDMPVTQDEALRARLNALVTTGDESGAAENLERRLRDLKNRCRYNKSGLLPQAEAEAAALEQKLRELERLDAQIQDLKARQNQLEFQLSRLENHRDALAYAKAQEDAAHVVQARQAADAAAQKLQVLEEACAGAPSREQAQENLQSLQRLHYQLDAAQADVQALGPVPQPPEIPVPFRGMEPEDALESARADAARWKKLRSPAPLLWLIPGILAIGAAIGILTLLPEYGYFALAALGVGTALWVLGLVRYIRRRGKAKALAAKYGSGDPAQWVSLAKDYVNCFNIYNARSQRFSQTRTDLDRRMRELREALSCLCGEKSPQDCHAHWQQAVQLWDRRDAARQEHRRALQQAGAIQAIAKDAPPPKFPDQLTGSPSETQRLISDTTAQLQLLQRRLGQCQGQMEAIGHRSGLESSLMAVRQRIEKLEDTYAALNLALTTLETARAELQRRFAPKIAGQAQELMRRLTAGRYDRLVLADDLSLHATAQAEDTLRTALWRSDGTMDQLYLSLRLAVAGELMPGAPLILDDALVRFDDDRLKAALTVLQKEAQSRQVLLFTCQSRESQMI